MPLTLRPFVEDPLRFNVRHPLYGGKGDNVTDDSAAITAAFAAAAADTSSYRTNVYFPAGMYRMVTAPPMQTKPIGVIGDGHMHTFIRADTALVGDMFSWSECWRANSWNPASTPVPATQTSGVIIEGLTVVGDLSAGAQQNAFVFYDRNDDIFIHDVEVYYLPGAALSFGAHMSSTAFASCRESTIINFSTHNSGLAGVPIVEFNSFGAGDSTNEFQVFGMDLSLIHGPGLVIRNNNTGTNVGLMSFHALRVEGIIAGGLPLDLVTIGDATAAGGVSGVSFFGARLIVPQAGQFALTINAPNNAAGVKIFQNNFYDLYIANGAGGGMNILAGRNNKFEVQAMSPGGTGITIGPASNGISTYLTFDGMGKESDWTWSIDATSKALIRVPLSRFGDPTVTGLYSVG